MKLLAPHLLSTARRWYLAGVTPIPTYYASKHPAVHWKAWAQCRPTWEEVLTEFSVNLYRGISLLMGGSTGLTVLDFDAPLPYYRWRQQTAIESYTIRTSRGYHVYFFLDEPPLTTLSMVGGEVKGNGCVVTAPSTHPSGAEYQVVDNGVAWPVRAKNLHELGVTLIMPEKRPPVTLPPVARNDKPGLIAAIKQGLPLTQFLSLHTELSPSGDDFLMGVCPFHTDHDPSLWVNARLQICGCFAPHCPAHGRPLDVINAYGLLTGIQNGEAIADLARQLGL